MKVMSFFFCSVLMLAGSAHTIFQCLESYKSAYENSRLSMIRCFCSMSLFSAEVVNIRKPLTEWRQFWYKWDFKLCSEYCKRAKSPAFAITTLHPFGCTVSNALLAGMCSDSSFYLTCFPSYLLHSNAFYSSAIWFPHMVDTSSKKCW